MCCLAYAHVLQWAYHEAQGLSEVKFSAILGLVISNQFMLYPQRLCHSVKSGTLAPFLLSQKQAKSRRER